jgi:hypothetical protein
VLVQDLYAAASEKSPRRECVESGMTDRFPRVVWILWLQGWESAPEVPQACLTSWKLRNPGWDVRPLDRKSLDSYVDLEEIGTLPPEALSDYARVHLLNRYGGVWVDATVFCMRPLDSWLDTRSGFFAFEKPGADRPLASWFLAAEPGNAAVAVWSELADQYWEGRSKRHLYYWLHALFLAAYEKDETARRVWDRTPKLRSDGPHYFVPYGERFVRPLTRMGRARLASGRDPVYKLNWRFRLADSAPDSAMAFFCGGAEDADLVQDTLAATADQAIEWMRWRVRHARMRIAGRRRPDARPNGA